MLTKLLLWRQVTINATPDEIAPKYLQIASQLGLILPIGRIIVKLRFN
jgi:hypothetical protein